MNYWLIIIGAFGVLIAVMPPPKRWHRLLDIGLAFLGGITIALGVSP